MIQCPKCGADNMIGAIFCRTCGEKLDLDEIRPETENQRSESLVKNLSKIAGRVVGILILVVVLGAFAGMFIPSPGAVEGDLSRPQLAAVRTRYMGMLRQRRGSRRVRFSEEEATAAANRVLGLQADPEEGQAQWGLVPEHLSLEFLSSGYVRAVLRSRLLKKIPVYTTVVTDVSVAGGQLQFDPISVQAGRVPVVSVAKAPVIERFEALVRGESELQKLRSRIKTVEVNEGEVTFTL